MLTTGPSRRKLRRNLFYNAYVATRTDGVRIFWMALKVLGGVWRQLPILGVAPLTAKVTIFETQDERQIVHRDASIFDYLCDLDMSSSIRDLA